MRVRLSKLAAVAALALCVEGAAQAQEYPYRDITTVVVWGAGGRTDTINRMIMAEMEKHLPVSIKVINQTGGVAGSNGMVYVANQPDDGYTLVGLSESNVTAAVLGGWDKRFDFWHPFIVGGSPDLISVPAGSPYDTLQELVEAAKAAPGTIPAAASVAGSIHHLNLLAIEHGAGVRFKFVPYKGSAAGQEAAMAGEVALVVTSLAEQAPLIEGGQLKPLAMLTPESVEIAGMKAPSAFDIYDGLDKHLPLKQAIGFAVRNSASDEVKAVLGAAFEKAMASDAVAEWARANHYDVGGQYGAEAQKIFATLESTFAYTLKELGAAVVDPESLGIPRP
ncbi:Bug family tripartite tricarboxylate transporter substrate binding protein [Oceanicella actignis]|uniref:Tripartite-type tricarboxylate transporter, receptor component TctC n=1 Tax=Oceanicella actignis TaxID=1189325 RepID=A0A1M7T7G7_9RHOB|nr:tripartite tricarboxylate transporter substrate binding protein [Oceanicella actignis]SET47997.1 Tripartite-type tricarboxylate transporter, receptor component TctC [Oceanicella actignis]SHN66670.1 Tripartite-type tricarboxylate transporter, receptor component TctC [Oceanicella actignis]